MTTTREFIESLSSTLEPTPPNYMKRMIAMGLGLGALVAAIVPFVLWGPRPDFAAALETFPLWVKFAFTGALALCGAAAVIRLARPGGRAVKPAMFAGLTVLVMAVLAIAQLISTPESEHLRLLYGATAASCPWLIIALSGPVLAGGFWAMRAMAPTRLALAGAWTGLAAGASAAFFYAFSCDESAMPFVFVWYGLGILAAAMIGAALGPRLLRW